MLNSIKKWRTARSERKQQARWNAKQARWNAQMRSVCDSWMEDFKRMREKENE